MASDDWFDRAACRGFYDLFHLNDDNEYEDFGAALELCRSCPVQRECLDYSIHNMEFVAGSIWGGFTPRPRQALAKANSVDDLRAVFGGQVGSFVEDCFA